MWRGTRWLNIYVGARANHTVHYLEQGTAHLFRLQAPRASSHPTHPPIHPHACTRWLCPLVAGGRLAAPPIDPLYAPPPLTSVTHPPHPSTAPTHGCRRRTTPTAGASRAPPPPSLPSRGHWPASPRRLACRASTRARACAVASSTWREASPSDRAAARVARCASSLGLGVVVGIGIGVAVAVRGRVTPPTWSTRAKDTPVSRDSPLPAAQLQWHGAHAT